MSDGKTLSEMLQTPPSKESQFLSRHHELRQLEDSVRIWGGHFISKSCVTVARDDGRHTILINVSAFVPIGHQRNPKESALAFVDPADLFEKLAEAVRLGFAELLPGFTFKKTETPIQNRDTTHPHPDGNIVTIRIRADIVVRGNSGSRP